MITVIAFAPWVVANVFIWRGVYRQARRHGRSTWG
jgi:hypothetical protein